MFGHNYLADLVGIVYNPPKLDKIVRKVAVTSEKENILNEIFSKDIDTGFPVNTLLRYQSENTTPEVRQFINDYVLVEHNTDSPLDLPDSVRESVRNLPSDFIAQVSRNRFESVEQYEDRVNTLVESLKKQEFFARKTREWAKRAKELDNE